MLPDCYGPFEITYPFRCEWCLGYITRGDVVYAPRQPMSPRDRLVLEMFAIMVHPLELCDDCAQGDD